MKLSKQILNLVEKYIHRPKVIKEKVTYPHIEFVKESNPCAIASMPFDHLLGCGHTITTPTPNEACGKNCMHVVVAESDRPEFPESKVRTGFHCQACVEEKIEEIIKKKAYLTVKKDDKRRSKLRRKFAGEADLSLRKCYIGMKVVSIPCDEKGHPVKGYKRRADHHPFDVAIPQIGDNMFEDIPPERPEEREEMSPVRPPKRQREDIWMTSVPIDSGGPTKRAKRSHVASKVVPPLQVRTTRNTVASAPVVIEDSSSSLPGKLRASPPKRKYSQHTRAIPGEREEDEDESPIRPAKRKRVGPVHVESDESSKETDVGPRVRRTVREVKDIKKGSGATRKPADRRHLV